LVFYQLPLCLGISGGRSRPSGRRCRFGFGFVAWLSAGSTFSGLGCFFALATSLIFFLSSCSCFLVFVVSANILLSKEKLIVKLLQTKLKWGLFILADDKTGANINKRTIYANHFIITGRKMLKFFSIARKLNLPTNYF